MRTVLLTIAMIVALCVASAATDVRVVELQHRDGAQIASVLQQLLGPGASAVPYEGKVILRGAPGELEALEEVIRSLDTPRERLRISVRQSASRTAIERGAQGDVRLGTGGAPASQDRVLGTSEHAAEQALSVLEGESALIVVGREVPLTRDVLVMAGRQSAVVREVEHREATTGFRVRPQLRGEEVQVDIVPHMVFLSPSNPEVVEFQHLATTVRIPLGEWYNVADHISGRSDLGRAILTLRAGGKEPDRAIWIKVERP